MVDDKVEPRETNWRHLLPWTTIFQGFRVALDLNKLMLAALGILVMAFMWWLLAVIFNYDKPHPGDAQFARQKDPWASFQTSRQAWNLMHEAAGNPDSTEVVEAEDLAGSQKEADLIKNAIPAVAAESASGKKLEDVRADARAGRLKYPGTNAENIDENIAVKAWLLRDPPRKPSGRMRTWPWYENRGSNPYLLVTGQAGQLTEDGTPRTVPWEKGHFVEWMATEQGPVLLEPLVKMLRPVNYFFSRHAGPLSRFYFLLVMLVTVVIWAVIGGAITRIAVVQVARQEKIGAREALTYTLKRYLSFISGPIFPLILVAVIVVGMIIFGLFFMIPILGDVVGALLWVLMVLAGLGIIVILVGLLGWPLMVSTISAEGTDSWEAVSRSYSYVFQAPWHYLFYGVIALVYGAVLVFFVGFMGSAMVYFAKWGVEQTPFIKMANRDPVFLFAYAPTSYQWRALLLEGATVDDKQIVKDGLIQEDLWRKYVGRDESYAANDQMTWYNKIGAFLVMVLLFLVFLLILGFSYSYFWSASTIIYLLMRRKVDDTEIDEVYLEEEQESPYGAGAPFTPPKPAAAAPAPDHVTMVEAPTLRTPPPEEQPAAPPPAASGDGNPPEATPT